MMRSLRYQPILHTLYYTLHNEHAYCLSYHFLNNVVITTVIEMVEIVEILDGRLGKHSVERVRYVINNLLHLVIVKLWSHFNLFNSILYNARVEIGGYTIQFYHRLEQPFRSYCHKNIGIFVYNPMGGVQLLYTKWVTTIHFQWRVTNIQILKTSHYQLQII